MPATRGILIGEASPLLCAPAVVRAGEYSNPVRIVAFNTAEGWSRDVTVEIADEVRRRYVEYDEASAKLLRFLDALALCDGNPCHMERRRSR